jgi:hypothetical protein
MQNETQNEVFKAETTASAGQLESRGILKNMFNSSPIGIDDKLFNLGLYTRSSLLVKYLVMNQIYERIIDIPGAVIEFGVWYGQNLVLLENLRSIHEPFNKQRKIVGFDTFTGYQNISGMDSNSIAFTQNSYSTQLTYKEYLEKLLVTHEKNNVLGHIHGQHELIAGDVTKTAPEYFTKHPETIVALAMFDIGTYNPTKAGLLAIKPHLIPGSVILLDELTWPDAPGESIAFKEVFADTKYKIEKIKMYPSKSIVTIL